MTIENRYLELVEEIKGYAHQFQRHANEVQLIAVTKGCAPQLVLSAYRAGCRNFGESRLPEAILKIEATPQDAQWHLIGTLQKNKVRKAIGMFALIHSVDSLELAAKISDVSLEMGKKTAILLQANMSGESSKHGLSSQAWKNVFGKCLDLPGIEIRGLMTMAPLTDNEEEITRCFSGLRILREELQNMAKNRATLQHLSMGMSHDYRIAIREGATLLRIGTSIFGSEARK